MLILTGSSGCCVLQSWLEITPGEQHHGDNISFSRCAELFGVASDIAIVQVHTSDLYNLSCKKKKKEPQCCKQVSGFVLHYVHSYAEAHVACGLCA